MKLLLLPFIFLASMTAHAQLLTAPLPFAADTSFSITKVIPLKSVKDDISLQPKRWKLSKNHIITGALVFTAGLAKGFNETLHFHWKEFHRQHPKANGKWFNPAVSWRNKYANNDPDAGPKFVMSTSLLVMVTDQYHLNNFINRMAWGAAMIVKIGEKKRPFKQYLLDFLYYTACHQTGFALTYYPYSKFKGK